MSSYSAITGAERVTHSAENDQLLYFTSTSLLSDDRGLVFISDRVDDPNLFFLDFRTGEERQLTHNVEGTLKSYVYFRGRPYEGLGKASVSLDSKSGIVYFIQGREIRAVDTEGNERTLAELPDGEVTAFTHVSADGRRLCVPTTDARALDDHELPENAAPPPSYYDADDPAYDVDARVQVEGLSSYIRVYDTATGDQLETAAVPRAWITHVQFAPFDAAKILYNHEYCSEAGVRRMWVWDGTRHRMLRREQAGGDLFRSRHDWLYHEMWEREGGHIIYHGAEFAGKPCYVGRVTDGAMDCQEIALPREWNQYGHFSVGERGQLVTDGYYRTPDAGSGWGGEWISIVDVDWARGELEWRPLVRHNSSWGSQDAHPHPIFDEKCKSVYFTSDIDGKRAVYRVEV